MSKGRCLRSCNELPTVTVELPMASKEWWVIPIRLRLCPGHAKHLCQAGGWVVDP